MYGLGYLSKLSEITTAKELEKKIENLKHTLKKGERAELIVSLDLIEHVTRYSLRYGLSLIEAEELPGNKILVVFEYRFVEKQKAMKSR